MEELVRLGAQQGQIVARLIGGARMFETAGMGGAVHMGELNVMACHKALLTTWGKRCKEALERIERGEEPLQ